MQRAKPTSSDAAVTDAAATAATPAKAALIPQEKAKIFLDKAIAAHQAYKAYADAVLAADPNSNAFDTTPLRTAYLHVSMALTLDPSSLAARTLHKLIAGTFFLKLREIRLSNACSLKSILCYLYDNEKVLQQLDEKFEPIRLVNFLKSFEDRYKLGRSYQRKTETITKTAAILDKMIKAIEAQATAHIETVASDNKEVGVVEIANTQTAASAAGVEIPASKAAADVKQQLSLDQEAIALTKLIISNPNFIGHYEACAALRTKASNAGHNIDHLLVPNASAPDILAAYDLIKTVVHPSNIKTSHNYLQEIFAIVQALALGNLNGTAKSLGYLAATEEEGANDPFVFALFGHAYRLRGNHAEAAKEYDQAIRYANFTPKFFSTYLPLALSLEAIDRNSEACILAYTRIDMVLTNFTPNIIAADSELRAMKENLDRYKAAFIDGEDIANYVATCLSNAGTPALKDKVILHYSSAILCNPENYAIFLKRANAFIGEKKFLDAYLDLQHIRIAFTSIDESVKTEIEGLRLYVIGELEKNALPVSDAKIQAAEATKACEASDTDDDPNEEPPNAPQQSTRRLQPLALRPGDHDFKTIVSALGVKASTFEEARNATAAAATARDESGAPIIATVMPQAESPKPSAPVKKKKKKKAAQQTKSLPSGFEIEMPTRSKSKRIPGSRKSGRKNPKFKEAQPKGAPEAPVASSPSPARAETPAPQTPKTSTPPPTLIEQSHAIAATASRDDASTPTVDAKASAIAATEAAASALSRARTPESQPSNTFNPTVVELTHVNTEEVAANDVVNAPATTDVAASAATHAETPEPKTPEASIPPASVTELSHVNPAIVAHATIAAPTLPAGATVVTITQLEQRSISAASLTPPTKAASGVVFAAAATRLDTPPPVAVTDTKENALPIPPGSFSIRDQVFSLFVNPTTQAATLPFAAGALASAALQQKSSALVDLKQDAPQIKLSDELYHYVLQQISAIQTELPAHLDAILNACYSDNEIALGKGSFGRNQILYAISGRAPKSSDYDVGTTRKTRRSVIEVTQPLLGRLNMTVKPSNYNPNLPLVKFEVPSKRSVDVIANLKNPPDKYYYEHCDFTVNRVMYNPKTKKFILPDIEVTLHDLFYRIIRCERVVVGTDKDGNPILAFNPRLSFENDPLRMLRAVYHYIEIDGQIEKDTMNAIRQCGHLLRTPDATKLPKDPIEKERALRSHFSRINIQLKKMFFGGNAVGNFQLLKNLGLLHQLFPNFNSRDERLIVSILETIDKGLRNGKQKWELPSFKYIYAMLMLCSDPHATALHTYSNGFLIKLKDNAGNSNGLFKTELSNPKYQEKYNTAFKLAIEARRNHYGLTIATPTSSIGSSGSSGSSNPSTPTPHSAPPIHIDTRPLSAANSEAPTPYSARRRYDSRGGAAVSPLLLNSSSREAKTPASARTRSNSKYSPNFDFSATGSAVPASSPPLAPVPEFHSEPLRPMQHPPVPPQQKTMPVLPSAAMIQPLNMLQHPSHVPMQPPTMPHPPSHGPMQPPTMQHQSSHGPIMHPPQMPPMQPYMHQPQHTGQTHHHALINPILYPAPHPATHEPGIPVSPLYVHPQFGVGQYLFFRVRGQPPLPQPNRGASPSHQQSGPLPPNMGRPFS